MYSQMFIRDIVFPCTRQFDIGAKDIEGYKLVKAPNMDEYKDLFYRDKPTSEFVFEYVADG